MTTANPDSRVSAEPDEMPRVVHCRREPYDVYIGRPGFWGNPFKIGPDGSREGVLKKYRDWLLNQPDKLAAAKTHLRGKILGCWCAPKPCHGDVLLEVANAE